MINTAAKAVQIKTTMGNHQIPTNTGRTEKTSYQSCQAHRGLELINTWGTQMAVTLDDCLWQILICPNISFFTPLYFLKRMKADIHRFMVTPRKFHLQNVF